MTFLSTKKRPFEKTTSSKEKTKSCFKEKNPRTIFGTFDENHGLNMQNFQL